MGSLQVDEGRRHLAAGTRELLGRQESKIGVIRITEHQSERLSQASVVSGKGFQAGDVVKLMP